MCQLSLASPKFPEGLSDSLAFNPALYQNLSERHFTEKSVKLSGSGSYPLYLLALLHDSHAGLEAHRLYLRGSFVYLLGLLLSDTLDVEHLLFGARYY